MGRKFCAGTAVFCLALLLSACSETGEWQEVKIQAQNEDSAPVQTNGELQNRFGDACISEQTFEVELSEYNGKVWFVPFSSGGDGSKFHMQIVRWDGEAAEPEVLQELQGESLGAYFGGDFESLDAVSFYDMNYDGETDILLLGRCGGQAAVSVYYGYDFSTPGSEPGDSGGVGFSYQQTLSENLNRKEADRTVAGIRALLSEGKRNGEFSDWQQAYRAAIRLYEAEGRKEMGYDLIDVDGDDIPELAAGVRGYWVSLYTFSEGTLYQPAAEWPYGAGGNAGYEYSPGRNSLRNYNTDFAGAILYTTYMRLGETHSIDTVGTITSYQFDDVNQNGVLDENEEDSVGKYGVTYIDGVQVPADAADPYDVGGYEFIDPALEQDTVLARLEG